MSKTNTPDQKSVSNDAYSTKVTTYTITTFDRNDSPSYIQRIPSPPVGWIYKGKFVYSIVCRYVIIRIKKVMYDYHNQKQLKVFNEVWTDIVLIEVKIVLKCKKKEY